MQIAIDGPAGAGKTSVSKEVARRLGIMRLDTGAMYRALGYKVYRLGIDPENELRVSAIAKDTNIDLKFVDGEQQVLLDGEDITGCIRTPEYLCMHLPVLSTRCPHKDGRAPAINRKHK